MTKVPNNTSPILDLQAQVDFQLLQQNALHLQKTGKIRLLHFALDFKGNTLDTAAKNSAAHPAMTPDLILHSLIAHPLYHEIMFLHSTQSWKEIHGPFDTKLLNPSDYAQLNAPEMFAAVHNVMHRDRWQSPEPETALVQRVYDVLESLVTWPVLLRLTKTDSFNEQTVGSQRFLPDYEHEWAHALIEFHEFLFIDVPAGRLALAMFIYE